MKLEIKPVFEWKGNSLFCGNQLAGYIKYSAFGYEAWFGGYCFRTLQKRSSAIRYLEKKVVKGLYSALHGAQYEVSE